MQNGFIQIYQRNAEAICGEIAAGLLAPNAWISPKYLYDGLGSKLFAAICELPEYYPTRTEAQILERCCSDIARSTGRGATLIDLGAGNCEKAARLFSAVQPAHYVPIDISVDFLRDAVESLRYRFPQIRMTGLGMDFSRSLELPDAVPREKRLFFYPGSSIGNFMPEEAAAFLGRVREACRADGGLLIGVDLLKHEELLQDAYDDAIGLTAAFNLNMLQHINHLLKADFRPRDWRHVSRFNAGESRIELHLEARRDLTVVWEGGSRHFAQGERIHTENSYKYTPERFLQLLERAGFGRVSKWIDPQGWFMLCHARAA
ncbi:MAG TPA: L-histidine N(alpha)-methyltransferase [Noviherbaspirillum sp.]|uniref:L-histidine N(alpha)-methyltransferase n=1 Tax=Noviherbaspirillum sp. TaxID=1926288 RepID=UPI002B468C01|nr:L-histidine N(alpha)-methyltransferase [Noviherbaspirillum sp.]HJV85828.1 L-histidine N(alpha)-methyltransferase [Noviherbaspirillum sp.]